MNQIDAAISQYSITIAQLSARLAQAAAKLAAALKPKERDVVYAKVNHKCRVWHMFH